VRIKAPWLSDRRYRMIDYNNNCLEEGTCQNDELAIPSGLNVYLVELAVVGGV